MLRVGAMAISDDSSFSVIIGCSGRAGGIEVEDGARHCVDHDARVMMWWKYKDCFFTQVI